MIIELLGASGASRTALARELSKRLGENGETAEVVQSDRPATADPVFEPAGTGRIFRGIAALIATAAPPIRRRLKFGLEFDLVAMLPPANADWSSGLRRHIVRLNRSWTETAQSDRILILEQGFVQTVCLLASHSRAPSEAALEAALALVPKADLVIRIDASTETSEADPYDQPPRLVPAEGSFEADSEMNLAAMPIIDRVSDLLREHGTPVVCLSFHDGTTPGRAVDRAIGEIMARRAAQASASNAASQHGLTRPTGNSGPAHDVPLVTEATGAAGTSRLHAASADAATGADEAPLRLLSPACVGAMLPYLIGALLAFLVELLAARVIGRHSYGIYAFAFTWASVVAYSSTLGFNISLQRLVPTYLARQESDLARGVIQYAGRRTLATAMAAAVVGATFITMYPAQLRQEVTATCLMGLATAPLITLLLVNGSATRSFGGILSALAIERVVLNGLVLAMIFLTAWYHLWPRDATLAMGSTLVGSAMAVTVLVPALREVRPQAVRTAVANYAVIEWRSSIAPLTIVVAAEIILNRAGVIVLGLEGSIGKAAIFGIALGMATLPTRPLTAAGRLITPLASRVLVRNDRSQLQALLSDSSKFSLVTAVLIAIPLLLLTDPLLDWLGEDFERATSVFRILLVGQLVAAAFGPQQQLITMAGHERTAAATLIVGAAVNITATVAANRFWGLNGAAAATAATLIAWNLATAILLRLRLQISPGLTSLASTVSPAPMPWSGWLRQSGQIGASTTGSTARDWSREGGTRSADGRHQPILLHSDSYRRGSTGEGYGRRYVRTFAEGYYAIHWRKVEAPLLREVLTGLATRGATRSLDFACGTGRILELHEEVFDDIVGTDISPEMLAFARKRYPDIRFVEADLTTTGAIEAVRGRQVCTAFRFFLNAEPSLRSEVLDVLRNCLVEEGVLVANFHGNPASLVGLVYPIRNRLAGRAINKLMSEGEAIALLETHGFEVEQVHWYGLWPPVFRRANWLNELCIAPAEALGRRFPALMRRCQTFVIVARRR